MVQRSSHMTSALCLVYTQIVNIQRANIGKNVVITMLLEHAKCIAEQAVGRRISVSN